SRFSIGCSGSLAAPPFSPSPCSLTAMLNPGLAGFSGVKIAPAPMLSASMIRQVPRIAPRILLSSKEFIEIRLPGRHVSWCGRVAARAPAAAMRYRFAWRLATRISAALSPVATMPDVIILIPARLASTRLPGKPLADLHGMPMIVHVLRRAEAAAIGEVVVATDSEAGAAAVERAGGRAAVTRSDQVSG